MVSSTRCGARRIDTSPKATAFDVAVMAQQHTVVVATFMRWPPYGSGIASEAADTLIGWMAASPARGCGPRSVCSQNSSERTVHSQATLCGEVAEIGSAEEVRTQVGCP